MRYKHCAVALAAAIGLLVAGAASAQNLKIGVVDLGRLVQKSPQAQQARAHMKSKFSSRRDKLESQRNKLQSDMKRLKRDGKVMSNDARQKLQDSVRDQQRRLQLAQSEYQDDVRQAEQKELGQLRKKISDVINQFATQYHYDLIVGDGILYADNKVDITNKVLAKLKSSH